MKTMKAQCEEQVEIDLAKKRSLKQRLKELEKEIFHHENVIEENDKMMVEQKDAIDQQKKENQVKYNEGILLRLESPLNLLLEK